MSGWRWLLPLGLSTLLSSVAAAAPGQTPATRPLPSSWPLWTMSDLAPVSPAAARASLLQEAAGKRRPRPQQALTATETEATPEIIALARALGNDAGRIFAHVHDRVAYTPTFGSVNGATATLVAGRGNDWDQASLLIALLRAAGYTADYALGDVTYPLAIAAEWVGVANDPTLVSAVFVNGGIPGYDLSPTSVTITRVWVQAVVGGQTCLLDPAMKRYQATAGIDLGAILGYDRGTLMARALDGATVTTDGVWQLNEANIRADMAAASMNLVNHLRTSMPLATVTEVLGGRSIIPAVESGCPVALPWALAVTGTTTFAEIPALYRTSLRLQLGTIDETFYTFQISGRRVSLTFRAADNAPELRVDGTLLATGGVIPVGGYVPLNVMVDHPYAGTGGDQSFTFHVVSGRTYVVASDLNCVSNELMVKRNEVLGAALRAGAAPGSEAALGESLWLAGIAYHLQRHLYERILGQAGRVIFATHHMIGILGQESSYMMDMAMGFSSICRKEALAERAVVFRAMAMLGSAFEHGALEQLGGSDTPAASTIKMLQLNNAGGSGTFLASSSNWAAVQPLLIGYAPSILAGINAGLATGGEFLLTQKGVLHVDDFHGSGYIEHHQVGDASSMGMIIHYYLSGGAGMKNKQLDPKKAQQVAKDMNKPADKKANTPQKDEPVDMATGNLHHQRQDVTLPNLGVAEIAFRRYYSSGDHDTDGSLGYGWRHNLELGLRRHSNPNPPLGSRQPIDAASVIAYTHVVLDLLQNRRDAPGWLAASLAAKWAMDQMIDNMITVHTDSQGIEYVRLADASYNPPPGFRSALVASGSSMLLQGEGHSCYVFDQHGRARHWLDANGNRVTFTYDPDGRLTQVGNSFGQNLQLAYADGRIATITDDGGRTVSYTYTAGNLTGFLDAGGHQWTYQYDAANRLLAMTSPEGNTPVSTAYDELGRVATQTTALGEQTAYFFDGRSNRSTDPGGPSSTYAVEDTGRLTGFTDPAGHSQEFEHDGQGFVRQRTDRLGGTASLSYHLPSGRVATRQDAGGHTTSKAYAPLTFTFHNPDEPAESAAFTYYYLSQIDYPDGTETSFEPDERGNIVASTDQNGSLWSYSYNGRGQLLEVANPLGGVVTYTYNADGTLATQADSDIAPVTHAYDAHRRLSQVTYPDGRSVAYAYDPNDRLTSVTHENGTTTEYTYDGNGNRTHVTDPLGRETVYLYDLLDRPIRITDRTGASAELHYDSMGRPRSVVDAGGGSAELTYDALGRVVTSTVAGSATHTTFDAEGVATGRTSATGGATSLVTDALGQVRTITDPLGQSTQLERDALGRVTSVTDALSRQTQRTFDARGLLATVTMPVVGTASFQRNQLGFLDSLTDLNGRSWSFGHTSLGRLASATDPLGNRRDLTYNAGGQLVQMLLPGGLQVTLTYDPSGNVVRRQYSDGTDVHFTFDGVNRLVATDGLALTRDAEDRVTRTADGATAFDATYDAAGRLQTVAYWNGAFTVTYAYDAATGLLASVTDSLTGAWVHLAYDGDGQTSLIQRSNGVTTRYDRDAAGQLLRIREGSFADLRFTSDAQGQITRVDMEAPLLPDPGAAETREWSYDAASQLTGGSYQSDPLGRITATPEHQLTWAGELILAGVDGAVLATNGLGLPRTRSQGGQSTEYFYNFAIDTQPLVGERSGSARRAYVWTPTGQLLYLIDQASGNAVRFHHFDQVGSTLALTDAGGQVTDAYAYSPHGLRLGHQGTSDQPFTFVGRHGVRQEGGGGDLYQMHARYYDARVGRFLSRDPSWPAIADPRELNPYQYVANNPVNLVDPFGRAKLSPSKILDAAQRIKAGAEKLKVLKKGLDAQANSTTKTNNKIKSYGEAAVFGIISQVPGSLELVDAVTGNRTSQIGKPGQNLTEWLFNLPAYTPPDDAVAYVGGGITRDVHASAFTLLRCGTQFVQDLAWIEMGSRETPKDFEYQGFWPELKYQLAKEIVESKVIVPGIVKTCELVEEGYTRIGEWTYYIYEQTALEVYDQIAKPYVGTHAPTPPLVPIPAPGASQPWQRPGYGSGLGSGLGASDFIRP